MINLAYILIALLLIFGFAPAAFGGLRNARGIFTIYFVAGVFLPGLTAFVLGHGADGDIVEIVSPAGLKAIIICFLVFIITVMVSISFEFSDYKSANIQIFRPDRLLARRFAWLSIVMTVSYLTAMAMRFGGIAQMTTRLYARVALMDSVANLLSVLAHGSFVFAVLSIMFARKTDRATLFIAISAVTICGIESLLLGGRSVVALLIVAIFYKDFVEMKLGKALIGLVFVIGLVGVISYYMVTWRYAAQGVSAVSDQSNALAGLTFVDHIAASIEYARDRGIDYGQLYINALLLPIPRDLWPSKPLQISVEMRDYIYGDVAGGNPPGLFGEAYIAFGTIGPLMIAVILGILLGWINRLTNIATRFDCRLRAAIAGVLGPLFAFALVRGGFDIGVLRVGVPAAWCLIAYLIVRQHGIAPKLVRSEAGHAKRRRGGGVPRTLRPRHRSTMPSRAGSAAR